MELNRQQQAAVEYENGHVLVLAGAGTGKTRTIIARAAHLVKRGVKPERILLLSFTRRAAREMVDRLNQMVGAHSARILAGTFHHFCLYSMRRMPSAFQLDSTTVIDRDDQLQLLRLIRSEIKDKTGPFPRASELLNQCSYARNTLRPMGEYLDQYTNYDAQTAEKVIRIFSRYDERKRQNGYLDYDDILFRFVERLHDPDIGAHLRGLYDHILVDEMQDTNPLQWEVLQGLRDPAKLFCVGDDAQSIYAFRGADFRNVHSFTSRVPNSVVLRLEENYRSTQGILELSNWLLKQSPVQYGKRLTAVRKEKSTPVLMDFSSDIEEARWVVDDLRRRHENGTAWRDIMIITRTGYGARAVESYMVEEEIPYQFIGGTSLLQTAHVKDLLSMVRAAANHRDELAWARYLTLWPRIGDATAAKLIHGMNQRETFFEAMTFLAVKLKNRENIINGPRQVAEQLSEPAAAMKAAVEFLSPMLETRYENWRIRRRDLDLLVRLSGEHRSLSAFLEIYTLDPISVSSAQRKGQEDVVTLTTVHSAKGTQAPVCYLIRVEPGMYPHLRSLGSEDQMEEERRILYVAITRAKDELIVTRTWNTYGWAPASFYGAVGPHGRGSQYLLNDLAEPLVQRER
ncbi:MAG: ATP-dependent helicase [Desulfobacterales bacterium]|jgi:DNA helicase-2/ATP-dependent DNA helicase PcrA|nr:ATP-dependent helicase [Desulfobacterales bacterium]